MYNQVWLAALANADRRAHSLMPLDDSVEGFKQAIDVQWASYVKRSSDQDRGSAIGDSPVEEPLLFKRQRYLEIDHDDVSPVDLSVRSSDPVACTNIYWFIMFYTSMAGRVVTSSR
jgi:hypothetical protein